MLSDLWDPAQRNSAKSTRTRIWIAAVVLVAFASVVAYLNFHVHDARSSISWSIPRLEHVAMHIIPSSERYRMGSDAWKHLLPSGGHVVHVTEADGSLSTHTVAMFHQLRCLEILQDAYVNEGSHRTSPLAAHCMNYLHQTLLCQMDMRNEIQGSIFTYNGFDQMCFDWEVIYAEAEKNFEAYSKLIG
ncbi:hypothetical protein B0H19DRAFT_1106236 [Mycena capillaripes]|nr:hypothetical protein B0H19DRAFT_1106236 [Mycena capillaripes]